MNQKWTDIFRFKDRTGTNDWLFHSLLLSLFFRWYFFLFHSFFLFLSLPLYFSDSSSSRSFPLLARLEKEEGRRSDVFISLQRNPKEKINRKILSLLSFSLPHSFFFSLESEMISKNRSRKCASERKWLQPWSWRIFQERKKDGDWKRRKRNRWEGKRVITTSIILLEKVILQIFASLFLNPKLNHREERKGKRVRERKRKEGRKKYNDCLKWNQMETRRSSSLEFIP